MDNWLASDSSALQQTELVKQGILLPDRNVPMEERTYMMGGDDYVVAGMAVMFFLLALILYRSRAVLLFRLKNFFTSQRTFEEEKVENASAEAVTGFLLICISALCLSCLFLVGRMEQSSFITTIGAPYWLFAAGLVACLVFVGLKAWLYSIVNWTFFDSESSHTWMKGYLLLTGLTAFLFYPLTLLDVFAHLREEIVTGGAILVVVLYELLLFYKLNVNFRARKYGYVLIFLYFCTVELLPTLVFGHLALWFSDNYIVNNILY